MNHSHLALQHLIRNLDTPGRRRQRPGGPGWLPEFVDQVAELFEPFLDVGRVGFECTPGENRWEISMYLGCTEQVGGKSDGAARPVAFQFNLTQLPSIFDEIELLDWNAFPPGALVEGGESGDRSFIRALGRYRDSRLCLRIFSLPPRDAGPGMRQYADGSWEPA